MLKELGIILFAFLLALAALFLAEKIAHLSEPANTQRLILALEFGAVILIFASFVMSEFLKAVGHFVSLVRKQESDIEIDPTGPMVLMLTVSVSLAIYFCFLYLAKFT